MFIISTFFAMVNKTKWGYHFHAKTVIVILGALILFGLAACLSKYAAEKFPCHVYDAAPEFIPVKTKTLLIVCGACILAAAYSFYSFYLFSIENGNPGGFGSMIKYIREAMLEFKSPGRFVGHISIMLECISYIFAFIVVRNTIFYGIKARYILFFIPMLCYMLIITVSGGRTEFIYITVFILMSGFICFMQKHQWEGKYTIRLIIAGLTAFLVFLLIFRVTGLLKSSGVGVSVFTSLSKYAGFGIPALDEYILNLRPETGLIGDHTLSSVYSVLRSLGFNLPQLYMPYDFINFPGIDSNIYTALRRYIEDYTYLGMCVMVVLISSVYTYSFEIIKKKRIFGFALVCFCSFCYPLFEFSIEERFLMRIISTTTIYQLLYLSVFYYFFIYRVLKKRKIKKSGLLTTKQ